MRLLLVGLLTLSALACGGAHQGSATVREVLDGDTIVLQDSRHVRLVQLDAPETDEHECYAPQAERALERLVPPGTAVEIETDPALDKVDRFGRTLAYVEKDGANMNVELVRAGAAAPWFFRGDRGRYASLFLQAADEARRHGRGLWGACPHTPFDPLRSVEAQR
ncbi:MAG: thermonuclease family protein [Myxococcales bacterium]